MDEWARQECKKDEFALRAHLYRPVLVVVVRNVRVPHLNRRRISDRFTCLPSETPSMTPGDSTPLTHSGDEWQLNCRATMGSTKVKLQGIEDLLEWILCRPRWRWTKTLDKASV